MADKETPIMSIEDFMGLSDASESQYKQFSNEDYLSHLVSTQARNAAYVAEKLGVTAATVVRRLKKLADQVFVKYDGKEPFYVLNPEAPSAPEVTPAEVAQEAAAAEDDLVLEADPTAEEKKPKKSKRRGLRG